LGITYEKWMEAHLKNMEKRTRLTRAFYNRNTLLVARELLGKVLVHRLPNGAIVRGRIVETEAYAGLYDPGSHTYQDRRTERNQIWYGEGGFAYVYQIYGTYFCLGIITEPEQVPGAVLVRAVEPTDGIEHLQTSPGEKSKPELLCAGPSKLCIAMGIDKRCNGLDLCGDELYLEDIGEHFSVEDIVFSPRINIDYAGHGALAAWRYYLRGSQAISKKTYEPLRDWRVNGYPSQQKQRPVDLFSHLVQREEESTMSEEAQRQIQSLPKIELHLHLEGMVRASTLRTLCDKNRVPLPAHVKESDAHYFGSFDEFVYTYHTICQALVHAQDFALLIADVADYLKRNTILYAEIAWTPFLYLNRKKPLRFEAVMEVMNEALEVLGIADRIGWIIDIQRDHGVEAGAWVYQQVFRAPKAWRIVGVGLVGQEEGFSPSEYQVLYHQAQELGFGTTAHAGEYGTAEDIWQCVRTLGVKRIGHGIRAIHDRKLLDYLVEHGVHLEICPTSNVRLERVMMYSGHPLQDLWRANVNLGLNSDDPGLFSSDLSDEYSKVIQHCGFPLTNIHQTLHNSLAAAFLPVSRKEALVQRLDHDWRKICHLSVSKDV
jgi:DNA-3-methyladenine glycosylase